MHAPDVRFSETASSSPFVLIKYAHAMQAHEEATAASSPSKTAVTSANFQAQLADAVFAEKCGKVSEVLRSTRQVKVKIGALLESAPSSKIIKKQPALSPVKQPSRETPSVESLTMAMGELRREISVTREAQSSLISSLSVAQRALEETETASERAIDNTLELQTPLMRTPLMDLPHPKPRLAGCSSTPSLPSAASAAEAQSSNPAGGLYPSGASTAGVSMPGSLAASPSRSRLRRDVQTSREGEMYSRTALKAELESAINAATAAGMGRDVIDDVWRELTSALPGGYTSNARTPLSSRGQRSSQERRPQPSLSVQASSPAGMQLSSAAGAASMPERIEVPTERLQSPPAPPSTPPEAKSPTGSYKDSVAKMPPPITPPKSIGHISHASPVRATGVWSGAPRGGGSLSVAGKGRRTSSERIALETASEVVATAESGFDKIMAMGDELSMGAMASLNSLYAEGPQGSRPSTRTNAPNAPMRSAGGSTGGSFKQSRSPVRSNRGSRERASRENL